jgi:protein-S-isoprenylcysteine O-methyltransferase Ste14
MATPTVTRMVLAALLQPAAVALVLFYPPGEVAWPRAWALVAIFFLATVASLVLLARTSPALLAARFAPPIQRGQPVADRIAVLLFVPAFAGAIRFVPYDVFSLRVLPPPGRVVAALGVALVVVGWVVVTGAMHANAFAIPVVKSQADRRQRVVDRGPYAIVRHPMYAGIALVMVGMPLWLGSTAGALVALVPIAILAVRIGIEERFLRAELDGYAEYAARVRARLVPGVW